MTISFAQIIIGFTIIIGITGTIIAFWSLLNTNKIRKERYLDRGLAMEATSPKPKKIPQAELIQMIKQVPINCNTVYRYKNGDCYYVTSIGFNVERRLLEVVYSPVEQSTSLEGKPREISLVNLPFHRSVLSFLTEFTIDKQNLYPPVPTYSQDDINEYLKHATTLNS